MDGHPNVGGASTPVGDPAPELLQAFLSGRDALCPACGYNLRNLRGGRCPECGEALVLQVGVAEPRQAAAIAGAIALAAGAGMSGLLLGYLFVQIAIYGRQLGGVGRFFAINFFGLVIEGAALTFWLRYWRAIRRLNANARWGLVGACCALTLAYFLTFSLRVR